MAATKDNFEARLQAIFSEAERLGLSFIGLTSKALHQQVGGYPGKDHRMPVCCEVMRSAMEANDEILAQPRSGDGATVLIRYSLPRSARRE